MCAYDKKYVTCRAIGSEQQQDLRACAFADRSPGTMCKISLKRFEHYIMLSTSHKRLWASRLGLHAETSDMFALFGSI